MIAKRESYVEEAQQDSKYPVRNLEVLTDIESGQARYVGQVALGIQTPMGVQQLPVSFEIEAESVKDAFGQFEERAEQEVAQARQRIQQEVDKARHEEAGRIVRPGEVGLGGGGGPAPGGAQGGGNVIDLNR
jgi:hypothetical protein